MTCSRDDSGACCWLCDYNPVVVIATHRRKEITVKNISALRKQTFAPQIVVVCSEHDEFEFYQKQPVKTVMEENRPLGLKWQAGVRAAYKMQANPLIILGSDDILHFDYIRQALIKLEEGYDFVGMIYWYSYDLLQDKVYRSYYRNINAEFPIGSGKVFGKKILDACQWKLFDTNMDRRLDDRGHKVTSGFKVFLFKTPEVVAVKGDWPQLNTIDKYLKSPNIKTQVVSKDLIKDFYIYENT